MKKQFIFNSLMILGLAFVFGTVTSCNRKGCMDSVAENYSSKAKKDDGTCTYARTKFIGSYSTTETCTSGSDSYTVTISESSSDKTKIVILNLWDAGESVTGTVSGNTVTFNQTNQGFNFSGTGTISGTTLTINYSLSGGGFVDNCTATAIKQ
jgi:hypothetical protein